MHQIMDGLDTVVFTILADPESDVADTLRAFCVYKDVVGDLARQLLSNDVESHSDVLNTLHALLDGIGLLDTEQIDDLFTALVSAIHSSQKWVDLFQTITSGTDQAAGNLMLVGESIKTGRVDKVLAILPFGMRVQAALALRLLHKRYVVFQNEHT